MSKGWLFITLVIFIPFLHPSSGQAESVYVHTDNSTDLNDLVNRNSRSIISTTNLIALASLETIVQFEYMKLSRTLSFMLQGVPTCAINKIKTTERKDKFLFSLPVNLFLNKRLYQHQALPKLANDTINLMNLFRRSNSGKLLISSQISYGETLDNQIKSIHNNNKLVRKGGAHDDGIIQMFIKKRAEYTLLYPQQIYELGIELPARSYSIEGIEPYIVGHIMCNKVPESYALIKKLNENLHAAWTSKSMFEAHIKHIPPQDRQAYKEYHQQIVTQIKATTH